MEGRESVSRHLGGSVEMRPLIVTFWLLCSLSPSDGERAVRTYCSFSMSTEAFTAGDVPPMGVAAARLTAAAEV